MKVRFAPEQYCFDYGDDDGAAINMSPNRGVWFLYKSIWYKAENPSDEYRPVYTNDMSKVHRFMEIHHMLMTSTRTVMIDGERVLNATIHELIDRHYWPFIIQEENLILNHLQANFDPERNETLYRSIQDLKSHQEKVLAKELQLQQQREHNQLHSKGSIKPSDSINSLPSQPEEASLSGDEEGSHRGCLSLKSSAIAVPFHCNIV